MSGIVGHTMYGVLTEQKLRIRHPGVADLLKRNWASYLSGAYLGCDIQTLPEAICSTRAKRSASGTVPLDKSPLTGGPVKPWTFRFDGAEYRPRDIHDRFYGRAHLVFGWNVADRRHTVPWDHLADYLAMTFDDAVERFPAGESKLAYLFGWLVHIVGDSLIKSIRPGLEMKLLDGLYTPRNRPVQDLVTYHEIGIRELGLDWPKLLGELAAAPVEPVQLHYMRVTLPRGALAASFRTLVAGRRGPDAVRLRREPPLPEEIPGSLLPQYELTKTGETRRCDPETESPVGG